MAQSYALKAARFNLRLLRSTEAASRCAISTSTSRLAAPTPGSDIQEDSSADAEALKKSKKIAEDFEGVKDNYDHAPRQIMQGVNWNVEKDGEPVRNPEVAESARSGKGFPHQSAEERASYKSTNTEGESQVKTREYTPKENTKLYEDKK